MTSPVALVTGGSSGIGQSVCDALKESGYTVFEFSRHDASRPGITHISADVTSEQAVKDAVAQVEKEAGRIDLLVLCAGFGISGAVEFTDPADSHRQMDVNLFGTDRVIRHVLPIMRRQKKGRIICFSSVAAVTPIPFQTWYSAGKAAINAYAGALSNEVRPFGIDVCAVMPGDIRTGFTAARKKSTLGDEIYAGRISRSVSRMEKDEQNGMDPAVVGRFIARLAKKRRIKPKYSIGLLYKFFCLLEKILPCRLVNRILYIMYG